MASPFNNAHSLCNVHRLCHTKPKHVFVSFTYKYLLLNYWRIIYHTKRTVQIYAIINTFQLQKNYSIFNENRSIFRNQYFSRLVSFWASIHFEFKFISSSEEKKPSIEEKRIPMKGVESYLQENKIIICPAHFYNRSNKHWNIV